MKLISLCVTFCLLLGCTCDDQQEKLLNERNAKIDQGYMLYTTGDTLRVEPYKKNTTKRQDNSFLVSKDALAFLETEIYTDVAADVEIVKDNNLQIIDTILTKLHLGIRLNVLKNKIADLSGISTADTMNVENIIEILKDTIPNSQTSVFDPEAKLHIYLFDRSSFFKTANAIAFESGEHKFIFGNAHLFKSSMLFVHELGHVLGLNHSKEEYGQCFNIMHESSIGCAKFLHPRQSLAASTGVLIGSVTDTAIVFPEQNSDCTCLTSRIYKSKLDVYLNARDQGIEDESLVGNLEGLEEAYNAIVVDTSRILDSQFIKNFIAEAEFFLSSPIEQAYYVNESRKAQKVLQKNNLLRLMSATIEKLNPSARGDFLERIMVDGEPSDTLAYYFENTLSEHDPSVFYRDVEDTKRILSQIRAELEVVKEVNGELEKEVLQLQLQKDRLTNANFALQTIVANSIILDEVCYKKYTSAIGEDGCVSEFRALTERCRPSINLETNQ